MKPAQMTESTIMAPKKETILGSNTPIALGLVFTFLSIVVGFGWTAGSFNKEIQTVNLKVDAIERRETNTAKYTLEVTSRLARIEALLEDLRKR